jgi:hypothetical protein
MNYARFENAIMYNCLALNPYYPLTKFLELATSEIELQSKFLTNKLIALSIT